MRQRYNIFSYYHLAFYRFFWQILLKCNIFRIRFGPYIKNLCSMLFYRIVFNLIIKFLSVLSHAYKYL